MSMQKILQLGVAMMSGSVGGGDGGVGVGKVGVETGYVYMYVVTQKAQNI